MANPVSLDGPFPAVSLRFTLGHLLKGIRLSYARALMETGLFVLTRVPDQLRPVWRVNIG